MHFNQLLKERYSVRKFKAQKVSKALMTQVLEAGRMAPSAANRQPWCFIVVSESPVIDQVKEAYDRDWFKQAPQIIVACGNHEQSWKRSYDDKDHCDIDVAIAIDHMTLRATELGLGTCWVCHFDTQKVRESLELPEYMEPVALLPIGYPQEQQTPLKIRKDIHDIVFEGKYGKSFS
ncbi:nitroreductase [Marinilabiliaceae bacterium JC017]|nr:nitroreductase [Marinilabiliaceae bacterium JC017]